VTHAHPIGIDGAAVQAQAVARAVALNPAAPFAANDFLQALLDAARTPEMEKKLVAVGRLMDQDAPAQRAAMVLGQDVAVQRSLPFAIFCFLRHPGSFQDCLLCTALHGGDRDTLGAMACAISGAYLGVGGIPKAWREKLENRKAIEDLALRLAGLG
jgi:poly(ADP-ribose) glycohydrolase ARH3